MELIAGGINKKFLRFIAEKCMPNCGKVLAAVAYASSDNLELFELCRQHDKMLTFYGRYDESVPVSPTIIKWFLDQKNPNLECRVVPDILHAKVIWWVGIGAYIGSANLSQRAWYSNIEAGVFFSQVELDKSNMVSELAIFFEKTEQHSEAISLEFLRHLQRLDDFNAEIYTAQKRKAGAPKRFFGFQPGLLTVKNRGREARQKERLDQFVKEWNDSLQTLRDIAEQVSSDEYRPRWIPKETPTGAQVDQFLHAHYYHGIGGDRRPEAIEQGYRDNRNDPRGALLKTMAWWKVSDFDYHEEAKHLGPWAEELKQSLAKSKLPNLTRDEFVSALTKVHAIRSLGSRRNEATDGLSRTRDQLITEHVERLWLQNEASGGRILNVLSFVIWGTGDPAVRVWQATHDERWMVKNLKTSAFGEVIGWARPEEYPPKNGRTLKALKSLGFAVRSLDTDE